MTDPPVYTIGHSTHPIDVFIDLLRRHAIAAVADVRSVAYSRRHPWFNKETLRDTLKDAGIPHVYLGKELGARPDDPSCYVEGKVQFDRLARTALFRSGIDRVRSGSHTHRIAVLCAEREPLDCHRTILVSQELQKAGTPVFHILADGSLEAHADTMRRLVAQFGMPEQDLFRGLPEIIEDAARRQAHRIAYVDERLKADQE